MTPMTQPPPAGPPNPYGAPPARRQRPRGAWFAVAAVMVVLAAALVIGCIVLSINGFTQVEATVRGDGDPVTVAVDTDTDTDTDYLVWRHAGDDVSCTIVDADGTALDTADLGTTSYARGSWEGLSTFDPTGASVEITCADGTGDIQVGEKPHVETLVGGVLLGLVAPILLGAAGLVLLLVLAILWATGERRAPTARPAS